MLLCFAKLEDAEAFARRASVGNGCRRQPGGTLKTSDPSAFAHERKRQLSGSEEGANLTSTLPTVQSGGVVHRRGVRPVNADVVAMAVHDPNRVVP